MMATNTTQDAKAVMLIDAEAAADLLGDAADPQPGETPQPLGVRVLRVIEREADGMAPKPRMKRPPAKPVDETYWPIATDVAM